MVGGRWIAVLVGVVQRVGIAEHHLVGEGSAHHRLMVVVVEGVFAGELRQVRRIALGDVVKPERDIAFRERMRGRIAIAAGGHRHLNKGEQVGLTATRIAVGGFCDVAIELLPHLIEAMHRAAAVGLVEARGFVLSLRQRHQRIGAVRQVGEVEDAGIGRTSRHAGRAGRQQRQIVLAQAVITPGGFRERREASRTVESGRFDRGVAGLRCVRSSRRLQLVGRGVVGDFWCGVDRIEIVDRRRELRRLGVIRAGRAVFLDDSLGQQVVDMLALARLVGREHMIESPVFAHDDDDVLDRAFGLVVAAVGATDGVSRVSVRCHQ